MSGANWFGHSRFSHRGTRDITEVLVDANNGAIVSIANETAKQQAAERRQRSNNNSSVCRFAGLFRRDDCKWRCIMQPTCAQ